MLNKKAQVSLEMVIIVGVLVLGTIVLATVFINMSSSKVEQSSEIDNQTKKVVDDFLCSLSTSVNPNNSGIVDGAGVYPCFSQVKLTSLAYEGYTFSNWEDSSGNNLGSNNILLIDLNEDVFLIANFND